MGTFAVHIQVVLHPQETLLFSRGFLAKTLLSILCLGTGTWESSQAPPHPRTPSYSSSPAMTPISPVTVEGAPSLLIPSTVASSLHLNYCGLCPGPPACGFCLGHFLRQHPCTPDPQLESLQVLPPTSPSCTQAYPQAFEHTSVPVFSPTSHALPFCLPDPSGSSTLFSRQFLQEDCHVSIH